MRTARSRTSGENRLGRPIDPILSRYEASEKPGTIQSRKTIVIVERVARMPPSQTPRMRMKERDE
jgi:hypothetical protein